MNPRLLIAIVAVAFTRCQYNPFAHEFTRARPQERTVVGRYVPDRETSERLPRSSGVAVSDRTSLAIHADHTFAATELPKCWTEESFDCRPGTESWTGTWSLRRNQEWWALQLHIKSRNGQPTDYGFPAMLRREAPPYLVHFTIGDPDAGDALAFERR